MKMLAFDDQPEISDRARIMRRVDLRGAATVSSSPARHRPPSSVTHSARRVMGMMGVWAESRGEAGGPSPGRRAVDAQASNWSAA